MSTLVHHPSQHLAQSSDRRHLVVDPATAEAVASVEDCGVPQAMAALEACVKVGAEWSAAPALARARLLEAWADNILAQRDALARQLTLECGKPLAEAKAEVAYGVSFVKWFAEEARRIRGEVLPSPGAGKEAYTLHQPVGPVLAITPWNFPLAMVTRKVAPAIAAGCPVLLKPAEATPLSALSVVQLLRDAGAPEGLVQVLTGSRASGVELASALLADARIRKLSFTGSTAVGRSLFAACAPSIRRMSLELGGNAPFLIFEDADLDAAVEGLMAAKFRNAGQTCISPNRVLVHRAVREHFVQKLLSRLEALQLGHGLDSGTRLGPLISEAGVLKVLAQVEDASSRGAEIRLMPERRPGAAGRGVGQFLSPGLLLGLSPGQLAWSQETFGPVVFVGDFADEEEAISLANHTEFGLAAYAFTSSQARSWRLSRRLEAGMLGLNTGSFSNELFPFGGIKQSGLGREGSHLGISEYLDLRAITVGGLEAGSL